MKKLIILCVLLFILIGGCSQQYKNLEYSKKPILGYYKYCNGHIIITEDWDEFILRDNNYYINIILKDNYFYVADNFKFVKIKTNYGWTYYKGKI